MRRAELAELLSVISDLASYRTNRCTEHALPLRTERRQLRCEHFEDLAPPIRTCDANNEAERTRAQERVALLRG